MILELYNNSSLPNVVNKVLTNKSVIEFNFKSAYSPMNLEIFLQFQGLFTFNYLSIPFINRKYFIKDYEVLPNNIYKLRIVCDVLSTYSNYFINEKVLVQFGSIGNPFTSDSNFLTTKTTTVFNCEPIQELKNTYIISTIGG
ncbi:MAG: hypothetical protein ACRC5T_03130 [Cetobacterium sp.]